MASVLTDGLLARAQLRAAGANRDDLGRLLDLAVVGDEIAAALEDPLISRDAVGALHALLADTPVSGVIPISTDAVDLADELRNGLATAADGRVVLLDLLIATGTQVRRAMHERGLRAADVVVVALAASTPADEVDGVELRVPLIDRPRC